MVVTVSEIQEAEELLGILEGSLDALPILISMMKLAIAIGRRELRSEGLEYLVDDVDVPLEPVA